jgi:DNA recombination protein RmuC
MVGLYVAAALAVGVFLGASIVLIAKHGQSDTTSKILDQVERIGAIFTNAAHRGRAGEVVLENLLEATGLGARRDYDLQATLPEGGRPDVVLKFPARGNLAIDSKFPLDHFRRAISATTEAEQRSALQAHSRALALYVSSLAKRDYPAKLPESLSFVICYVPSEDLLAAAYEARPGLFYDAIDDHILLAGPTTLMAIFWSITYGLQQDARARNARAIGNSAAELHHRLGKLADPLQKLGRTMTTAVKDYNSVLGTLEGRVFPEVRRLENLGQFARGTELPDIPTIDAYPRPVAIERYPVIDNDRQHGQHADGSGDGDINFNDEGLTVGWATPDEAAALNQDLGEGYPDDRPPPR